jgi:hypothetical protein
MVLFANIFMKIRLCNGEMLFLFPICQAVLLIFCWNAVKSTDRVLFAHALGTSAQRALCDNNAKTDD